ncbi:hypothetical protein ABW41_09660 [Stenotrophomonas maltophilia]|nr:hypothetical protein ABW41_09660 [Stenotrophomonas maltophilia]
MLHANGSTQYCHDRFGQVTRKVQTVNGVASTLRYAYSKAGRLAALTYPGGSGTTTCAIPRAASARSA